MDNMWLQEERTRRLRESKGEKKKKVINFLL